MSKKGCLVGMKETMSNIGITDEMFEELLDALAVDCASGAKSIPEPTCNHEKCYEFYRSNMQGVM